MSEGEELKAAQDFIAAGEKEKALPLLWKLLASNSLGTRLDAGLTLLAVLDPLTQNDKLLEVTEVTLGFASALGMNDVRAYLLSKKAQFLSNKLGTLTYRQRNLNLAASVFQWIDFSLEIDKADFAEIAAERGRLKSEIASLEAAALAAIHSGNDHYTRGHVFMILGDIYFSRFLDDQLDLNRGGRLKSRIMNIYFVRRWHLDKIIGYNDDARRKLRESQIKTVVFFKRAIDEFTSGNYKSDLANALFNLAVKFALTFRFRKARKYLNQAKQIAKTENEKALFVPIAELEKRINDKYRHPRDYVEEFGLDLPRGLRG